MGRSGDNTGIINPLLNCFVHQALEFAPVNMVCAMVCFEGQQQKIEHTGSREKFSAYRGDQSQNSNSGGQPSHPSRYS
jgi:hypothetical protein